MGDKSGSIHSASFRVRNNSDRVINGVKVGFPTSNPEYAKENNYGNDSEIKLLSSHEEHTYEIEASRIHGVDVKSFLVGSVYLGGKDFRTIPMKGGMSALVESKSDLDFKSKDIQFFHDPYRNQNGWLVSSFRDFFLNDANYSGGIVISSVAPNSEFDIEICRDMSISQPINWKGATNSNFIKTLLTSKK